MLEYLSERGRKYVRTLPPLVQAHFSNLNNMYDKEKNPKGLINMGTAETKLVDAEVCRLLEKIASETTLEGWNLHYNKFEGTDSFSETIANYWQNVIFGKDSDRKLTKNNIATCAGCTVALENLAMLLAEAGDVFLIPAPYYSSFVDDINEMPGVEAVGIPDCAETMDREAMERAYDEQVKKGKRVRAILFSSPNNPVGIVYTEEQIKTLIEFAMDKDIDIISDEIYAQTVFDPEAKHVSTLKLVPKEYMHRVHVTSSFAKDFALSGFRTGFCISFNPDIITGMGSLTYYSSVSSYTQAMLTALIKSPDIPAVMQLSRDRLREAYGIIRDGLEDIGVPVKKAQAGIFVFADFSEYLDRQEYEREQVFWEKVYNELMINISPGHLFGSSKPGWFRACYAIDKESVEEACSRLAKLKK